MSFTSYIQESASLSEADIDKIPSVFEAVTLEKGGFFLRQGEICRHKIFVAKGLLRNFGTSDNGSEHIIQFCPENSWTLDVESFDNGTPARFNIAAVENSESSSGQNLISGNCATIFRL